MIPLISKENQILRRYYNNHKNSQDKNRKSEIMQTLVAGLGIPVAVVCLLWVILHLV